MEHFTRILSLSLAMLAGCYIAGSLPLSISLSEDKLHMVTVLGSGLLVGTALAVIIPEGVHALYDNGDHEHEHHHMKKTVLPPTAQTAEVGGLLSNIGTMPEVEAHSFIGFSLCLGFIFMLVVDYFVGGHSHTPDVENNTRQRGGNFIATIGLVVHAAADGVAMGAAVVSSKPDVEFIIFLAIMLHKAPAAFGLTTFLLHEGMQRNRIRRHLFIFSMAAPVMALLTYTGLSQARLRLPRTIACPGLRNIVSRVQLLLSICLLVELYVLNTIDRKEFFSNVNGTGVAMLFSAGTFLYVATVHVLPETINLNRSSATGTDGSEGIGHEHSKRMDLILLIIGIICPLLLTATHHHH